MLPVAMRALTHFSGMPTLRSSRTD
jgi:hypothetical protein